MRDSASIWTWPSLLGLLPLQLWVAHALVFFPHEYAHALVAWLLGWKASPLDLDYAHPSLEVLLLQSGINQNVDEGPIFASGHGADAALIAAAGAVLGNGLISLPLSRLAYHAAIARHRLGWALLAYWCTVASVGNFFDYVPIRTFTLEDDIGSVERGFGWSPWTVMIVLGVPTLIATIWFFASVMPTTLAGVFGRNPAKRALIAALTVAAFFGFYGAAGLSDGGPISHQLSRASILLAMPIMLFICVVLQWRSAGGERLSAPAS